MSEYLPALIDQASELEVSSDGSNEKQKGVVAACRALIFASASHLTADLLGCSTETSEEVRSQHADA